MMRFIGNVLVIILAVVVTSQLLPGQIVYTSLTGLVVFALVLGLLNAFILPLIKILTFPLTLLTLGLFSLVVNAAMFLLAAAISQSVAISSFVAALLAAVIVSGINFFYGNLV